MKRVLGIPLLSEADCAGLADKCQGELLHVLSFACKHSTLERKATEPTECLGNLHCDLCDLCGYNNERKQKWLPSDSTHTPSITLLEMAASTTTLQDAPTGVKIDALFVGPWHLPEFAVGLAPLQERSSFPHAASAIDACEMIEAMEVAPELMLLAQPLPGTVRQADVDRLQQLAPLARVVIVAGTWCEGELRTGHPPRGVLRLYWYELASWWQAAQRRIAGGLCPSWSQPLDHFQAGRFCADGALPALPATVAVDAEDRAVFAALADAVGEAGASAVWAKPQAAVDADAGIWDGGQLGAKELDRLRRFCRRISGNVVALLDFPRVEHFDAAHEAGAAVVFGKPYVVEEVLAAL